MNIKRILQTLAVVAALLTAVVEVAKLTGQIHPTEAAVSRPAVGDSLRTSESYLQPCSSSGSTPSALTAQKSNACSSTVSR